MKKEGSLVELPDVVKERPTDLAEVTFVPNTSFSDEQLIKNSEKIIDSHIEKASKGNSDALQALLSFNEFLLHKSIQVGDEIMVSKYVGTDFYDTQNSEVQTLVKYEDIIGLVVNDDN